MNETGKISSPQGNRTSSAKSLQRALTILECIAQHQEGVSVKAISEELGMNKPIISKILDTFEQNDYVSVNPDTHRFFIGNKILLLSHRLTRSMDLLSVARPLMVDLNAKTNESINLASYIQSTNDLVYISTIDGTHKLHLTNEPGTKPISLSSSAVGKALFASLSPQELSVALAQHPIQPRTRYSIRTEEALMKDLALVRKRGYAVANEETFESVIGIAATLYGENRKILGCIAVTGPKSRFPDNIIKEYGALVSEAARKISLQMGCFEE